MDENLPTAPSPTFGQALRAAREAKGLTRMELAAALEVHLNTVGMWERDSSKPGYDKLKQLQATLGVTL